MFSRPSSDHANIFLWAERHEAVPAEFIAESPAKAEPLLSFLFYNGPFTLDRVRPITWEEFFAVFDLYELSFSYEQDPGSSTYFQLSHAWPEATMIA